MSAAESKPTEKQEQVMKYLRENHVSEELNLIINKLCKDLTEDPYGYLARECMTRAKAPVITRLQVVKYSTVEEIQLLNVMYMLMFLERKNSLVVQLVHPVPPLVQMKLMKCVMV